MYASCANFQHKMVFFSSGAERAGLGPGTCEEIGAERDNHMKGFVTKRDKCHF